MLHPRVGREDEIGAYRRAEGGAPDRGEMQPGREQIPTEDPQSEEGRLEEEGDEALHGERRSEDVADEARVGRPVHPELEFLDDAGDDPDGEGNQHQSSPEAAGAIPYGATLGPPAPVGQRLHRGHHERQPDRDRDDLVVVDGQRRELPSGQAVGAHDQTLLSGGGWDVTCWAAMSSTGWSAGRRGVRPGPGAGERHCDPTPLRSCVGVVDRRKGRESHLIRRRSLPSGRRPCRRAADRGRRACMSAGRGRPRRAR
jgi:hypothetical protein